MWPVHVSAIYGLDMQHPPTPSKLWRIIPESPGVCLAGTVQSMQLTNLTNNFACCLCHKQIHYESKPRVKFQAILAPTAVQAELFTSTLVHNHGPSVCVTRTGPKQQRKCLIQIPAACSRSHHGTLLEHL